ncbi:hypothetical protein CCO03_01440 [Comamonas serinivorans]|uniref:Uncharacterized protein n=1 Tax=Comamonas serinivorans TaxID=1082851 RepID=A0A1Y0EIR5_9BURK|nr:hypothetical protein [Comamonas serinivorans]ARU03524.1 hypothetical protein CCO03_01440 [Comamonas serinivorans]
MMFAVFGAISTALFLVGAALLSSLHLLFGGLIIGACTALIWVITRGAAKRNRGAQTPPPGRANR